MKLSIRGRVAWIFPDFVTGDHIIGRKGQLDKDRSPDHLKWHVLTEYDADFPQKFRQGDIMVAGSSFGGTKDHGSVRALKALGVSIIIAESFGRVWMRRAITNALPVLACPGITDFASVDDELEVELKSGEIRNLTTRKQIQANPAIEPQLEILEAGDLATYLRQRLSIGLPPGMRHH